MFKLFFFKLFFVRIASVGFLLATEENLVKSKCSIC